MNRHNVLIVTVCLLVLAYQAHAQNFNARKLKSQPIESFTSYDLFSLKGDLSREKSEQIAAIKKAEILQLKDDEFVRLSQNRDNMIKIKIPTSRGHLQIKLQRTSFTTSDFQAHTSSGVPIDLSQSLFYWGVIEDRKKGIAAIAISNGRLSGIVAHDGLTFNLIKEENGTRYLYFEEGEVNVSNPFDCFVTDEHHQNSSENDLQRAAPNPDNCVRMYIEVDYDLVLAKGGVQTAANYVMDAFGQVAFLYAQESINLTVSEIKVWDQPDPYSGPNTSNYLTQFRNALNGQYNGDLAHLVGVNGGGGIAYLNVLCNAFYGVGYSAIGTSFQTVPAYSWTIEVLTHEIGHNLGSQHTHACAWNGNNTAIDGCGPAAGYSEDCDGPLPSAGTIMSYCHLVSGVGIDFNLGFGPQPGDLIRDRVYNAPCLTPCSQSSADASISTVIQPAGDLCGTTIDPIVTLTNEGTAVLTSVEILYNVDGATNQQFNWTGSLSSGQSQNVSLPPLQTALGSHLFSAASANPNGHIDDDQSNDAASASFTNSETLLYYADTDGDGYGDPNNSIEDCTPPPGYVLNNTDCNDSNDQEYPGAPCDDGDICTENDLLDMNCMCSGTPVDACDCTEATKSFDANPLSHIGDGTSDSKVVLELDSWDANFTISNLSAKLNGNPSQRYEDIATVKYLDANNQEVVHDTYSGANVNSATVVIQGIVNRITVSLSDGYDAHSPGQQISLSPVDYCSTGVPCPDDDDDGVCNADDICDGGDDNMDSDGDGIPDFCDDDCTDPLISIFNPSVIAHSGPNYTSSVLNFPDGNQDVAFEITGLDSRTRGKASDRFIETATVYYDDGTGEKVFDTYRGDQVESASVNITGSVTSVRVELSDGFENGTNNQSLLISLGEVSSCVIPLGLSAGIAGGNLDLSIYPNPAKNFAVLDFNRTVENGEIMISDALSRPLCLIPVDKRRKLDLNFSKYDLPGGLLFITLRVDNQVVQSKKILVVK